MVVIENLGGKRDMLEKLCRICFFNLVLLNLELHKGNYDHNCLFSSFIWA